MSGSESSPLSLWQRKERGSETTFPSAHDLPPFPHGQLNQARVWKGFLHGDVVTSWWRKDLKAWRTGSSKPPHLRAQQAKMGRGGGKPVGSDLLPQGSRSGLLRTEYSFSGISKRSFHDS